MRFPASEPSVLSAHELWACCVALPAIRARHGPAPSHTRRRRASLALTSGARRGSTEHAFISARDCRAVPHAVLPLGRRADEPRGPTRPGQPVMLRAGLVVRACATPRARSTRSRRALPSSLSMPAARDIHTFARRASTMTDTVPARVPLHRAVGRDQMRNISRPGHADPTRW